MAASARAGGGVPTVEVASVHEIGAASVGSDVDVLVVGDVVVVEVEHDPPTSHSVTRRLTNE
jgi:hypothetical protein